MGQGDADGVEVDDEWLYSDSGVLRRVLGISLPFLNRFGNEYLDPSLQVGARGGLGSASCPADCSLLELVEGEGTGSSLYICGDESLLDKNSSSAAVASLSGLVG
jgi:hypothetical protein